jgi:DNA-binding CsgD family transcriptional regulator
MSPTCPSCGLVSTNFGKKLTPGEVNLMNLISEGHSIGEAGASLGYGYESTKRVLGAAREKMGIEREVVQQIVYWNCELFQKGLRELNMLPRNYSPDEVYT